MAKRTRAEAQSQTSLLENITDAALELAKKARRHRKSLAGDNFYGNKLASLRADATNAFRGLSSQSAGDSTALAELVEAVFAAETDPTKRLNSARELKFALRTTWHTKPDGAIKNAIPDLFPQSILAQASRGYLVTVGRQMNGTNQAGWLDACLVMMRRLVEIVIIEAFEKKGVASKIKDAAGDYKQLSDLVTAALAEPSWNLSRNAKKYLPQLRELGNQSAHGRYFTARPEDVERVQAGCRVVIEEFLHHAELI
jgi:hypothetical protein